MKARGAYRATYESIDDDREWRKLSPLAKATFDTLKRKLGQYGINIIGVESLPRIINCTASDLEAALVELEAPKRGGKYGWIRREDDVLWIVNGLRFEPTLFIEGESVNQNHRRSARRHAEQLYRLTHLPIVAEFAAYYGLGSPEKSDASNGGMPSPMPSPMPPGMGGGMVGGITESESESETESDTESESDARARDPAVSNGSGPPPAGSASLASPSKSIRYCDLPPDVIEFGARFYGRAPAERRRKIAAQLLRLARGQGVRYKGAVIRAGSLDRLAQKCREILEGDNVRKHDLAIALLLVKLGDASDVIDEQRGREESERAADAKQNAAEAAAAEAWLADHPRAAASVDEDLEQNGFTEGAPRDAIASLARVWARRGLVIQAWRKAGAPEPTHA